MSDQQIEQLLTYAALIVKWNKSFNLVSRQDVDRLGARHLLDSLAGLSLLHGTYVLDLGSGAGLPGIPLAIAAPQLSFTLCDRSERRTRFLQQVVRELNLNNVQVWCGDFGRDTLPQQQFDTVVARGVATASHVWDMVHAQLAPSGRLLVYERTQAVDERSSDEPSQDELSVDEPSVDELPVDELAEKDEIQISRHHFDIPGLARTHSILCVVHA